MFGIKRYFKKNIKQILFARFNKTVFPSKAVPKSLLNLKIAELLGEIKLEKRGEQLGNLLTNTNSVAKKVWTDFLPFNPNNLGNWSIDNVLPQTITTKLERQVILQMIDLYNEKPINIEGYITSGATEGNIYSIWVGRKHLEQYINRNAICLVYNDLTHYSIQKGADIADIEIFKAAVDPKNWNTHIPSFKKLILKLHKKNYRGFLLPLTLGYTVGGTDDNIEEILNLVEELKRELKNIYFFCWIDAALAGLVKPFLIDNFKPFSNPNIQTMTVDFHKVFGVPYPSGLILYRKQLRKLIEKPIPYLKEKDNTVLGSRTGIAAVAIWATLQYFGFDNFKKMILTCKTKKTSFLKKIKDQFKSVRIIQSDESVQAALVVTKPLDREFSKKYSLSLIKYPITFKNKKETVKIYKLFFLPI